MRIDVTYSRSTRLRNRFCNTRELLHCLLCRGMPERKDIGGSSLSGKLRFSFLKMELGRKYL